MSSSAAVLRAFDAGRLDEALTLARQLFLAEPGEVEAPYRLACIHHRGGEIGEAEAWTRRVLLLQPDHAAAHVLLAELLLLQGRLAEGWVEYDWRFHLPGAAPFLPEALRQGRPLWDGGPLPGPLMLVGDQGFGDVIQFSRYVPWVLERVRDVRLGASDALAPLLGRVFPRLRVATRVADYADFTACLPLSSLPRLHGTTCETIPLPVPMAPEPGRVAIWRERLQVALPEGLRRIGLVWAGRPTHGHDAWRSIPFARLAEALAGLAGITLVSLQLGERAAERAGYAGAAPVFDAAPFLSDYEETAAALAALDGVVTVDTSVAHLAGSLRLPAAVLLPATPDWRWGLSGERSAWYPSLRLYRQPALGDWQAPLAAVRAALSAA
ncbi:tetratricopeptide repeat protein [Acidisoma sp. 7E03]